MTNLCTNRQRTSQPDCNVDVVPTRSASRPPTRLHSAGKLGQKSCGKGWRILSASAKSSRRAYTLRSSVRSWRGRASRERFWPATNFSTLIKWSFRAGSLSLPGSGAKTGRSRLTLRMSFGSTPQLRRRRKCPCHVTWISLIFAVFTLFSALPAQARVKLVALPERARVVLSLRNPVATLVEEERLITLQKGVNKVDFSW